MLLFTVITMWSAARVIDKVNQLLYVSNEHVELKMENYIIEISTPIT